MNIAHIRYALEVERTRSMSKAAENLYVSQPNLSRAIRELEADLGVTLFKRTSAGMTPTHTGIEFLTGARSLLAQLDELEQRFRPGQNEKLRFSLSAPRASYIGAAFSKFCTGLDTQAAYDIFYKETNAMRAINNILVEDYDLGILRYQASFAPYFKTLLKEKGLAEKLLWEFTLRVVMAENHPLADRETVTAEELSGYVTLAHADPYVPSLTRADIRRESLPDAASRHIYVYERGSQFELLRSVPGAYMWVSPIPEDTLRRQGLVEKACRDPLPLYRDTLIYEKDHRFSPLETDFLALLQAEIQSAPV